MKNRDLIFTLFWSILTSSLLVLTSILLAYGSNEGLAINEDTAVKLAMVASYHADYGKVSGFDMDLYANTDRQFVDSFELSSLDGKEKFYGITLYRAEGTPRSAQELYEAISKWGEAAVKYANRIEENTYEWSIPDKDAMQVWLLLYTDLADYRNYYSCVVPAISTQGFLFEFHKGISAYPVMKEFAERILANYLEVDISQIETLKCSPAFDFLFEVAGEEYVVSMPMTEYKLTVKILSGDFAVDYIDKALPRPQLPSGMAKMGDYDYFGNEEKAKHENILDWLGYVDNIESESGFSEGSSVKEDAVVAVLKNFNIPTLLDAEKKTEGIVINPGAENK